MKQSSGKAMSACYIDLFKRNGFSRRDDLISTAESFKSWNTCMDNKACKIIAIVGIAVACVVVLWLIGGLLTCFRQGVTGIAQFCCWCMNCSSNKSSNGPVNSGYDPNYRQPPAVIYQPIQQPMQPYYNQKEDYYNEGLDVYEMETGFDLEKQNEKVYTRQHYNNSPERTSDIFNDLQKYSNGMTSRESFLHDAHEQGNSQLFTPTKQTHLRPPPKQNIFSSPSSNSFTSPFDEVPNSSDTLASPKRASSPRRTQSPRRAPYPEDNMSIYGNRGYY